MLPWLQRGQGISCRRVIPACWRVLPPLRSIRLPPVERIVWTGDSSEPAYRAFWAENYAPTHGLSMWGSPPATGYLLVRRGATDQTLVDIHVELHRRSFELSATVLSGAEFWQDSFYCSQQVVASQISMHCRAILLNINMMQCAQELVLVGRNGVIDRAAII